MAFLDSLLSRGGLKPIVLRKPAAPAPSPAQDLSVPTRPEPPRRRPEPVPAPPPPRAEIAPPPSEPQAAQALAPLRRAVVLQARGEHEAAIAEFTRALELDPKCIEAWSGRGISREQAGDLAGAKADYARAIRLELDAAIERHGQAV